MDRHAVALRRDQPSLFQGGEMGGHGGFGDIELFGQCTRCHGTIAQMSNDISADWVRQGFEDVIYFHAYLIR